MTDVTDNLSVLRIEHDQLMIWRASTTPGQPAGASGNEVLPVLLAVPAEAVRLLSIEVSEAEIRHLDKSLPFLIEEDVAEDIDTLHFAFLAANNGHFGVGVIDRDVMVHLAEQVAPFASVRRWIPEPLLLPWQPGECVALVESDRVLMRWGEFAGTAVPMGWFPVVRDALPGTVDRWVIYGEAAAADVLVEQLGEANVDLRRGHLGNALMLTDMSKPLLDLRQGDYAPRIPFQRWWRMWRPLAVATAAAVVLQLGADLLHWQRLKAENLSLREAIQASYRRANPRGAVVDVEKQLDRQLAGLRGVNGAGSPFTPVLVGVVRAVAEQGDIRINTMNYSSNGDLRLSMDAPDFAAVETLRERLVQGGFVAVLEGTTARGNRVSARVVVESV